MIRERSSDIANSVRASHYIYSLRPVSNSRNLVGGEHVVSEN